MPVHPFQPVPDVASIAIRALKGGQQIENVWAAYNAGGWDITSLGLLIDAVSGWVLEPATLAMYPSDITFTSVYVKDLSTEDGPAMELPLVGGVGTGPGGPLSNAISFAVHKALSIAGKHAKGRVYHLGLASSFMADDNHVSDASMTYICDQYRALRDAIADDGPAGAYLAMISRVSGGVPLAAGVAYKVLDFICKDNVVDTQRRRGPGRGR